MMNELPMAHDCDDLDCGHCGSCQWWQTDADDTTHGHDSVGLCLHDELVHFNLQVSGDSGCNRFHVADHLHVERHAMAGQGI